MGARVDSYPFDELLFLMDGLITKTHIHCGFKHDLEGVNATIDEFIRDLQKYHSTLSYQEIEIYFKNGWKGVYGEFMGLNNKTYFHWINAGLYSDSRMRAKKAIEAAKTPEKKKVTDEQKEQIVKDGAIACFEHYKKNQVIYDMGNVTYDYLDKKELIPFTDEVKKQIYKDCKARMIDNEKMKLTDPANIGKHQGIKAAIKEIEGNKYLPAIAESKRVALKKYFDQLIEMEIELADEL